MNKKGFTLIEILIGLAILAILAVIVVAAVNPALRFQEARNTQRWSDVTAILDAVYLNILDNDGIWTCNNYPTFTVTAVGISSTAANICDCLADEYIGLLPTDPQEDKNKGKGILEGDCDTEAYNTDYQIWQSITTTGPIFVKAPSAEGGETIQISR